MSKEELRYLESFLLRKRKLRYSNHCLAKANERGIPLWIVKNAVDNGQIIEYHRKTAFNHRILIRGKQTIRGNNPCVVLDIFTGEVVTTFFNKEEDNHSSLDLEKYTSNLDIIKTITLGKVFLKINLGEEKANDSNNIRSSFKYM